MSYSCLVNNLWKTSRRELSLERPLVMGILNVTPDSFSDGGTITSVDCALRLADQMIAAGADILDIGGESTRPGAKEVSAEIEEQRVLPVIAALSARFDVPISIDTSKSEVAARSIDVGAEIINDISGLRFDPAIGDCAARYGCGLILMHSRGPFEHMHTQPEVEDIMTVVAADLRRAINAALTCGVAPNQIAVDPGFGFGKTMEQNYEILTRLGDLATEFNAYPLLAGLSRKSFIGRVVGVSEPAERLGGSVAAAIIAVQNGAKIVRVHDVEATVQSLRLLSALDRHPSADKAL